MITNRLGLPAAIVSAVVNDPYTKGDSDISVTQLIAPPYQRQLRMSGVAATEDVLDRIWSLIGQVGHAIVERAYPQAYTDEAKNLSAAEAYERFGVVAEKRLYMPMNGWTVSGQFDVIENGCLQDYKFTSTWSVVGDIKPEWIAQLNLLRLLSIHNGIKVDSLRIIAILRDWSKGKAKSAGYPRHQVAVVEIPIWSIEQTEAYMLERVKAHQSDAPPPCSDDERWKRPDVFAVMKAGRKSAIKLHVSEIEAVGHCGELGSGHSIAKRPGGFLRCQEYCDVSISCPQMVTEAGF